MRFLLTRRWLVASATVLAAVVVMVELGLWQLRRLEEVRARNDLLRGRLAEPVAPATEALASSAGRAAYRRVEATGAYDAANEILLEGRANEGRPGRHLLTPLVMASGEALVVDRGWIPLEAPEEVRRRARPPAGPVRVVGVLFPPERRGAFGPAIPSEGRLAAIPRIDLGRIAKQLPYPVWPLYLRLESQTPSQGALPVPPGLPALDEGPHLSYAIQWFLFAAVALAVFGALVRREARRRAGTAPDAPA